MSGLLFVAGAASSAESPTFAISGWVRNPSWPTFTQPTSSEEKIVGLFAVSAGDGIGPGANYVSFTVSNAFTVDWGDGTVQDFPGNTSASREISYQAPALAGTNAPVTLQSSTSTVNRVGHKLNNGDQIPLFDITGTTGLLTGILYYVVNATADSFQVSLTEGGPPVTFTGDGAAALLPYKVTVITITPQPGQSLTSVNMTTRPTALVNITTPIVNWLDLAISLPNASATGLILGDSFASSTRARWLERCVIVNHGACNTFAYAFDGCTALRHVEILAPVDAVTNMSAMFRGCSLLEVSPQLQGTVAAVTTLNTMFSSCTKLKRVSPWPGSFTALTDVGFMYQWCYALETIPPFPGTFATVTEMKWMFGSCVALKSIPPFPVSVAAVTNMEGMFFTCRRLESIPPFPGSVGAVTNMGNMFNDCSSLREVPPFPGTVGAVTTMSQMYMACNSLESVPPFPGTVASVTSMAGLFKNCPNLKSVPPFPGSTAAVTNMSEMFLNCYSLEEVPPFPSPVNAVTTMASMFSGCLSLKSIPPFQGSVSAVTSMSFMFGSCQSLQRVPPFPGTMAAVTNVSSMFVNCYALETIPAMPGTLGAVSNTTNWFFNNVSLRRITALPGLNASFSVASTLLSAAAINELCLSLASNAGGKTLTITGAIGSDTAVVKTSNCSTTAGSTTVNCNNTSGIVNGMFVTGSGLAISTDVTVSSDVAANTLTRTAHGLPNGTPVAFVALGTTTGITVRTIYYVVNATANTFQISLTADGAAIDLTGTNAAAMTIRYAAYVTAVNANVSYTLSLPAASTLSNQTHTFRMLDTSPALLKGWGITY